MCLVSLSWASVNFILASVGNSGNSEHQWFWFLQFGGCMEDFRIIYLWYQWSLSVLTIISVLYHFHIKLSLVPIKMSMCRSKWSFINGITLINSQFDVHIAILIGINANLMWKRYRASLGFISLTQNLWELGCNRSSLFRCQLDPKLWGKYLKYEEDPQSGNLVCTILFKNF